eukprot:NODE_7222_length_495_cov_52.325112_g6781_i0.p1 GENE.NODE_7222_length_495_cov_52.325112_g6781_i0~~NODE_7222_length_495_cov_52.325112_g6781_i0.p1  ORF type:complete len:142 (+),score=8.61 NODE_7222_length_495_cov_52.325112_g6781_i0:62-487(+)
MVPWQETSSKKLPRPTHRYSCRLRHMENQAPKSKILLGSFRWSFRSAGEARAVAVAGTPSNLIVDSRRFFITSREGGVDSFATISSDQLLVVGLKLEKSDQGSVETLGRLLGLATSSSSSKVRSIAALSSFESSLWLCISC